MPGGTSLSVSPQQDTFIESIQAVHPQHSHPSRRAQDRYTSPPHERSPFLTTAPHPRHLRYIPALGTFPRQAISGTRSALSFSLGQDLVRDT